MALDTPLRQSSIARFDSCPLSLRFEMEIPLRQLPGDMGHLGARGTLFHRFAAKAINWMRLHSEREIPVDMAMELLTEIMSQRDVPDDEVVCLPMDELRWLRILATKWCYQQTFHTERIVDVEERLYADIQVVGWHGQTYSRTVTGKPDVLIAGPRMDEATVIDWKSGHAPPPMRRERSEPGDKLSDMGYVQQIVYGWLVMKNYPSINRVTEREWYVMAKEDHVREASVERWEMERIEDILAARVSQIDAAIEGGPRSKRWFPVPGSHCGMCVGRRFCPVRKKFGIPDTVEEAQKLAREWYVAGQIRTERTPYLKGWVNEHGPVEIAHAKGRRLVGFGKSGSLAFYEPDEAPSPWDEELAAVARERGVLADG